MASAPSSPVIKTAKFVAGATNAEQLPPPTGIEIAFAGRSNVGKSSLMNALLQRKSLVRTSSTPGCTRQISFFEARFGEDTVFTMVDLPGYGYAKRSKAERKSWGELLEGYLLERPTLAAVAILFDVRRGLEEEELQLLELLSQPAQVSRRPLHLILVGTKLDKLPVAKRKPELLAVQNTLKTQGVNLRMIPFSTELPETHGVLWHRLQAVLSGTAA